MEPLVSSGTRSVPLPNTSTNRTSLVKSMAVQCLSPITAELPEEVVRRTKDIECEQKRLIAQLEQKDSKDSKPTFNCNSDLGNVTQQGQQTQQQLTPPSSTHSTPRKRKIYFPPDSPSVWSPEQSNDTAQPRSFGGRRSRKPRALDLDALRRERQFSGPYSANPLLSRKRRSRSTEEDSDYSNKYSKHVRPASGFKPLEPELSPLQTIRLPVISQMTTAPFVAHGSARTPDALWPPLPTPPPRSAVSSLPTSAHRRTPLLPLPPVADSPLIQLGMGGPLSAFHGNAQLAINGPEARISTHQPQANEFAPRESKAFSEPVSSLQPKDQGSTAGGVKQLTSPAAEQVNQVTESQTQGDAVQTNTNTTGSSRTIPSTDIDRKARYMQLCSELWDVLRT